MPNTYYKPPANYKTMIIKYKVLWVMINDGNSNSNNALMEELTDTDFDSTDNGKYKNYGLGIGNIYSTTRMDILTNNTLCT